MTRLEILFKHGILSSAIYAKNVADDKHDFGRGKLTVGETLALATDIIGGISKLSSDKQSTKLLVTISGQLAQKFSKHMTAEWEPGDSICPDPWWMRLKHHPWPPPSPEPWWDEIFNSDPMPGMSQRASALNLIQYAYILKSMAGIPLLKEVSKQLIEAGEIMVKAASGKVYDEYCGTYPPVPHIPGLKTKTKEGVTTH